LDSAAEPLKGQQQEYQQASNNVVVDDSPDVLPTVHVIFDTHTA
jgi:hypothetical protein